MHRVASFLAVWVGLVGLAGAAAPSEEVIQGLYEGAIREAKGLRKVEGRLVACGKGVYKLFIRPLLDQGKAGPADKMELDGKADGQKVIFEGKVGDAKWSAAYAGRSIKGSAGQGAALEMKRITRKPTSLGQKHPAGAIVLLAGKDSPEMTKPPLKDGKEQEWKIAEDGGVEIPKGGMNSKRRFDGSLRLHVEFRIPLMPAGRGQGRGNSGVYLQGRYEVQVLDSYGLEGQDNECGGIYQVGAPLINMCAPPMQWQTYDITFTAPRFNSSGEKTQDAGVTVVHNGGTIHDRLKIPRPTGGSLDNNAAEPGGIYLQDHGNLVQFRNIWLVEL